MVFSLSRTVAANSQQENPFQAHGELRQKADYIISHSRISRTEVQIADPDSPLLVGSGGGGEERAPLDEDDAVFIAPSSEEQPRQEPTVSAAAKGTVEEKEASGGQSNSSAAPVEQQSPQPGQTTVQVDVVKTERKQNESPQHAEQIKLKPKKRCAVQ